VFRGVRILGESALELYRIGRVGFQELPQFIGSPGNFGRDVLPRIYMSIADRNIHVCTLVLGRDLTGRRRSEFLHRIDGGRIAIARQSRNGPKFKRAQAIAVH
jgi:hypothetical protein